MRVFERRPDVRQRWRGRRWFWRQVKFVVLAALALALTVVAVLAVWAFATGDQLKPFADAAKRCADSGYACTIFSTVLFTAAPLTIGLVVFLAWRYRWIPTSYKRQAKEQPGELVETAGSIGGEVIGRDDLCNVLQDELRDPSERRPHVLVGGLGIGKTAVLVQLTNLLARRGAIPVPVRLRDAEEHIDFLELARERFLRAVGTSARSAHEGDRIWKQLLNDDRIVVLADGLEEAFADEDAGRARHHRVRVAVRRAHARRYPLIIASRPHAALRALDAALVHVEPLNEEAALDYIQGPEADCPDPAIEELIELAEVTETPLYLQIAHELHAEDLLNTAEIDVHADRAELRCGLLELWLQALAARKLQGTHQVPLDQAERQGVIEHLSALACAGLRDDTQQVLFDAYEAHGHPNPGTLEEDRLAQQAELKPALTKELEERLKRIEPARAQTAASGERGAPVVDMGAAASKAVRLGLVEPLRDGVRFPHSIMQAYLGARMMSVAVKTPAPDEAPPTEGAKSSPSRRRPGKPKPDYLGLALQNPGREMLLALVMYARTPPDDEEREGEWLRSLVGIRKELLKRVGDANLDEPKRLDIMSALVEIDTGLRLRDEADKLASIYHRGGMGRREDGAIADQARRWASIRTDDETVRESKLKLITRLGEAARRLGAAGREDDRQARAVFRCLYDICLAEDSYALRLAAAHQIGNGGDNAWEELRGELKPKPHTPPPSEQARADLWSDDRGEAKQRRQAVRAWLLPMLVGSVTDPVRPDVEAPLKELIRQLARLPLSIEAALAQGFKHAANRRPHHSHEDSDSRGVLQGEATSMLYNARFWYSRLTLIHALCLWELARIVYPGHVGHEVPDRPRHAYALVARWLRRPGGEREQHPFVLEAAELARRALESRLPTKFIWIDESGVVTKVGSKPKRKETHGRRSLWIAESAGWIGLDRRAQQLVADVLILLNLAERGDTAALREGRLQPSNSESLPLCLTEERCPHLKPSQTVGRADIPNPGEDCKPGCRVALCPYPPRGQQAYRVELSEAFCRRQQVNLKRRAIRGRAPWQSGSISEQRRFWGEMEERARKS
jgi:NACHT domain-containing protein